VLSGRASGLERLHRIMKDTGSEPSRWLDRFMGESHEASQPMSH